ncbi:MAG: serine/threonine-protein kinase [Proteobacteria bacterium]|nr:serine/threonine-protein kinase [Pseudomonadota bacterium]
MTSLAQGRYEVVRELGRGGMGEVFLARQVNLGRLVVIKRVLPEHAGRYVEALVAEAHVAARLHHPNIVSVLDVHEGDEPTLVVMEFVAGVTLREMIEHAPTGLPTQVALAIAIDVLRGLGYAHAVRFGDKVGVVHRDVKPRNLVVAFAGATKLIDFGISRWLGEDGWEATSAAGTVGYMAPELHGGRIDGRADQYAVAVTLREMLTGVAPCDEVTADQGRATQPSVDPALAAILAQAQARDPEARFADCGALVVALERYAADHALAISPSEVERWIALNLPDRVDGWEREAAATGEALSSTPNERALPPTQSPRRRGSWARWGMFGLLGIGLGVGGTLLYRRSTRPVAAPPAPLGASGTPLIVALDVENLGDARDAWLGPAVEHLTRRALRDAAARRFWIVSPTDHRGTLRLPIGFRRVADGIHLEARDAGRVIAIADAGSVVEATAQLGAAMTAMVGADRAAPGPDPQEAVEMARDGARTYDEYRRFRILFEDARIPTWLDSTAIDAGHEQLIADDPTWLHPYTELAWLYAPTQAAPLVSAARAHGDPVRDPGGAAILDALELARTGQAAASLARIEPAFHKDAPATTDPLVLEPYAAALEGVDREAESEAVSRLLVDQYPSLFYAGTQAAGLAHEGRDEVAERLVRASFDGFPENVVAGRELARIASARGDLPAAREIAQRMMLVHGERALVLGELYEAAMLADDTIGAQRLVDRMLLGSPLARARGRYRAAVIAVFEGRLAVAYDLLRHAIEDYRPFGPQDSELPQCLRLASTLAPLVGDRPATAGYLDELARRATEGDPALNTERNAVENATARFQAALARRRDASCPDPAAFTAQLSADPRARARVHMQRFASAAGCDTCAAVVAAGFLPMERDPESLVALGRCARRRGDLETARRSFERATQLWLTWVNHQASPYFAVLAHAELASVLAARGDRPAARAEYDRFLHLWGHADRTLPEVAATARALAVP